MNPGQGPPPLARDIPDPRFAEASWTSSLEVPPLVVLVSLLLPPMPRCLLAVECAPWRAQRRRQEGPKGLQGDAGGPKKTPEAPRGPRETPN